MNPTEHRILIASYHYPPDAAVGGLRLAKFTRYLAELGWQPYVLTVRDDLRQSGLDSDRMRGLEQIPVVRTGQWPRVVEALVRVKSLLRRRRTQSSAPTVHVADQATGAKEGFNAKLTRYVVSLLVLLPDEKKNWSMRAALTAPVLIRRHRISWILTSGPPFSVHVIGVVSRLFTRVRWVADFRDPWIDMVPHRFPNTRSRLSDALERWMEALTVRWADRVVTTTERMRSAMAERYPSIPSERFVCIPNSIDTAAIPAAAPNAFDKLTITYAGTLYFDRTPEPLFRAVADLLASGRASASDIRIVLMGDCRQINGVDTTSIVRQYGLDTVVELIDRVPYPEAVAMMQRSHLLLVLAPERHQLVVPAKIYDYLGTGSAVMALAESGATADLMAETQCGPCFSHTDIAGIREYLAGLLASGRFRDLRNQPETFARYDARALTARLVAEITRVEADAERQVMVRT